MSQKNELDPRAQRSRLWMRTALLELISEKGYKKITITDITDRAGLSRPTFYLHYKSKDEILVDYLVAIFDGIMKEFHELRQNTKIEDPGYLVGVRLFEEILKHIDAFETMLAAGAERLLLQQMYHGNLDYLRDLAERCEMDITINVLELSAQFLAGAFVGIIINWIQSENPDSPERMGKFYREITKPILRTVVCNGELDYIFR